jgi:hypothetical protein
VKKLNLGQAITWAIVIFLVWFVISQPSNAGNIIQSAVNWISTTGHSFGNALHSLFA